MSTEQRDVRPFVGPPALEALLRRSVLRFGVHEMSAGDGVVVEEHEFLHSPARFELAKSSDDLKAAIAAAHDALAAIEVSAEQVGFAIILQSSYLKILDVWLDVPLAGLLGMQPHFDLTSPTRPDPFRTPQSGCSVEALFYFRGDRPRRPMQPWRYGTWLARGTFEISTDLAFTGFTPQPLTAAEKVAKKLAPKTARFVTLNGSSPFEEGLTEDSVEVWCDADLLAKMSASPKAAASVALQRQLFVDAVAAIVHAARSESQTLESSGWADVQRSLLGRVVAAIVPSGGGEAARQAACIGYLEMIKNDPARFLSYVEETAGLLGSYDSVLGG